MKTAHHISLVTTFLVIIIALQGQAQETSFTMSQIGPDRLLETPWDLNYGPDDHLWVTERSVGVILRVNPETAERDELIRISDFSSTESQDGLLGLAIPNDLLDGNPFVYCSHTYISDGEPKQKLVRLSYAINGSDGVLSDPVTLIDNLPNSNDHNSGRLILGPDEKLYYTIGDQGGNQNRNYCNPILSQVLPTQQEVDSMDWSNYPGKILRLNLDGSIPEDNPGIGGVRSHVFSYGHRNPQGLVHGSNGLLYSDEHGPNTDDEVNVINAGGNYGWPNIVGNLDDQAYDYCNWSSLPNCAGVNYSNGSCPEGAILLEESAVALENYFDPLLSMFAVSDDYNYDDPACGNAWICRPNVAPSSLALYEGEAIPSWHQSLLVTSLKRGRVYRLKLNEAGTAMVGDTTQHFYTQNRYRDIVVDPEGKTFYIITDQGGRTADASGLNATGDLHNPGAILKFTLQEPVSTKNRSVEAFFDVWPNPISDKLHINVHRHLQENITGELINSAGQVVLDFHNLGLGTTAKDVSHLPVGIYSLRLFSAKGFWLERVILH